MKSARHQAILDLIEKKNIRSTGRRIFSNICAVPVLM